MQSQTTQVERHAVMLNSALKVFLNPAVDASMLSYVYIFLHGYIYIYPHYTTRPPGIWYVRSGKICIPKYLKQSLGLRL